MNVLLTGTSRGLGLELAREMVSQGHRVLGMNRTPSSIGENLCCDLSQPDSRKQAFREASQRMIPDVVIFNAALIEEELQGRAFDPESARRCFETNVMATLDLLHHFLTRSEKTRFVLISSLSALRPLGLRSAAYPASKAALNVFVESLRFRSPKGRYLTVLLGRIADGQKHKTGIPMDVCVRRILWAIHTRQEKLSLPYWKSLVFRALQWVPDSWIRWMLLRREPNPSPRFLPVLSSDPAGSSSPH